MKGISSFIEYTLVIMLGIVLVTAVTLVAYSFYDTAVKTAIKGELRQIAVQTSESVVKIYEIGKNSQTNPPINSTMQIATLSIPLPRQLAGKNYKITLIPSGSLWATVSNITMNQIPVSYVGITTSKVVTETTQEPLLSSSQDMPNIDVAIEGSSLVTNSTLTYYRYNINGNITDAIILGTSNIFIQLTGVS
ncbi:hypothetical protein EPN87_01600 [archaeon]|nr:MAG: hypothetical protein EPN87_01600 [archaeon]